MQRPDSVTQTIELNEETSLRKGRESITTADIQPGDHLVLHGALETLKPGLYLCQVNVIDDVAGSFSFPRFPLLIREPLAKTRPQVAAGTSPSK